MRIGPLRSASRASQSSGVLIVEDDFFVAADIAQAFEEAGVRVAGTASSVGEALAVIASAGRLDGAVLDINLGGGMAFPVAEELTRRGVPFLFATGCSARVVPARFAHVTRCEKPFDVTRVVALLLAQGGHRRRGQASRLEHAHASGAG